eukprot:12392104-Alexandrium_andersonii.AAC.1
MACVPPRKAIAQEVAARQDLPELLEKAKADGIMPQAYFGHPIAQEETEKPACPVILYIDTIAFSRHDS